MQNIKILNFDICFIPIKYTYVHMWDCAFAPSYAISAVMLPYTLLNLASRVHNISRE